MIRRLVISVGAALLAITTADLLAQSKNEDAKPCDEKGADAPCTEISVLRPLSETIEVFAFKRRGQQLSEAPQSVQIFSGEELEFRSVHDPVDALDLIPGASAGVTGGAGTQRYNFRGTGAMGSAGDLAVGFYVDDVAYYSPANPFGPAIRFFDLETLEVLRGPQGTLYGQGAMGGTMIIRTAQPDLHEFEARVRLISNTMEDGELGWKADLTASVPLVQDKVGLRLTAGRVQRSGLAESPDFPGRKNIDDGEAWDYRLKLLYEPTDKLSMRVTHWKSTDDASFSSVYASVDPPIIAGTGGIEGLTDNETSLSSLVIEWESPGGIFLKSSSSYTDYDDLYFAGSGFDALIDGKLVPFLLEIEAAQQADGFNQEITLSAPPSAPWDWIVGANYVDGDRTAAVTAEITSPPGIPTGVSRSVTETAQIAVFGEISRTLMAGLITPLLGVRWYRDQREFLDRSTIIFKTDDVFSTISPRFNLRVRASDDTQFYINVAKGFRSGTFNTQSNVDIAAIFGLSTAVSIPEATLWSYEVGGALRFLGGKLIVEPAVYYNDYDNYPVEAQIANAGVVVPVEKVTAIGMDLVALYDTPIENLRLSFTGHYNETQSDDPNPAIVTQVPALADGRQLPYVPQWSVNAAATYDRALTSTLTGFAYASLTRRDGQIDFITARKSPITDDLTLRLGVRNRADRWSLSLVGNNLTDDVGPAVITGGLQIRYDRRAIGLEIAGRF